MRRGLNITPGAELAEVLPNGSSGAQFESGNLQRHQPFQPLHALLRCVDEVLEGDSIGAVPAKFQLKDLILRDKTIRVKLFHNKGISDKWT